MTISQSTEVIYNASALENAVEYTSDIFYPHPSATDVTLYLIADQNGTLDIDFGS